MDACTRCLARRLLAPVGMIPVHPPPAADGLDDPLADAPGVRAPGWRSRDILRAVALGMGMFYALRMLWAASPIVLTGFLGLLFGLSLSAAADRLARFRVPRAVSAGGIVLLVYGLLVGGGFLLSPLLKVQAAALRERLPLAVEQIQERWERVTDFLGPLAGEDARGAESGSVPQPQDTARTATGDAPSRAPSPAADAAPSRSQVGEWAAGAARFLGPFLSSSVAALAGLLLVSFIAIYVAVDPDVYRNGALLLVPHGHRPRAREVMAATGQILRQWLGAQLVAMLVVGVVTTVGLFLLGVESALALGIVAGILEFVPFIGPIAAAIPAVAIALVDSPQKALWVVLFYVALQQLESTVLMPLLMQRSLELPPILTILAQGVMGVLFGLLGVIVAVPLLAAVIIPIKMLYIEDVVGDEVSLPEPAA